MVIKYLIHKICDNQILNIKIVDLENKIFNITGLVTRSV